MSTDHGYTVPTCFTSSIATRSDFNDLKQLLDTANEYALSVSGIPTWTSMEYAYAQLLEKIVQSDCLIIRNQEGSLIASISISDSDAYMWGEEKGADATALYLHKLIKDPRIAGKGIGRALLNVAVTRAKELGKKSLRCDIKSGTKLLDYYTSLGFAYAGTTQYASTGLEATLLEMPVSSSPSLE